MIGGAYEGIFASGGPDWVDALPGYQRDHLQVLLESRDHVEVAKTWLYNSGPANTAPYGGAKVAASRFYENFLMEFQKLLCVDDQYVAEQEQIRQVSESGKLMVMGAISAIVAPHVGVAATVLIPVIAVTLSMLSNAGRATLCQSLSELIEQVRLDAGDSFPPTDRAD
ncbi:hypothetical protein [Dietzia sp. UCD-THP]|uniref:hypothetical protein n=1 Tax=Dietzia sp. UCD-THP TaxID=1292020 RepID=UPI001267F453|nr:hypothetical protein [Dietzia sp. UCD-THP]